MTFQKELDEYEALKKIYNMKAEIHAKRFSQTVVESSYQDSCAALTVAYDKMKEAGDRVGIIYPVMI